MQVNNRLKLAAVTAVNFCVWRSSPRTTIDIPGTVYRLHASPSAVSRNLPPPIVLPDASSGSIDWDSLVSVASRALDGKYFIMRAPFIICWFWSYMNRLLVYLTFPFIPTYLLPFLSFSLRIGPLHQPKPLYNSQDFITRLTDDIDYLSIKFLQYVNWTGRMVWIVIDGVSW